MDHVVLLYALSGPRLNRPYTAYASLTTLHGSFVISIPVSTTLLAKAFLWSDAFQLDGWPGMPSTSADSYSFCMRYASLPGELKRRLNRSALSSSQERDQAFYKMIRSIPKGRVSTYGKVAAAAGYPLYHRAVAKFLRGEIGLSIPWQRVVGSGGEIKLRGDAALEQRKRLEAEGIVFKGKRIDMQVYEHVFRTWETD